MTISDPVARKKIKDALEEISYSLTRIEAERDLIKEIKNTLHEEYNEYLTKKQIAKMAKVYHKQSFDEEVADHDQFESLYQEVVKPE